MTAADSALVRPASAGDHATAGLTGWRGAVGMLGAARAVAALLLGAVGLAAAVHATLGIADGTALLILVFVVLGGAAIALYRPVWACALVLGTTAVGNREIPRVSLGMQVVHAVSVLAVGAVVLAVIAGAPADRIRRPELRLPLVFAAGLVLVSMISTTTSVSPDKSLKAIATFLAGLMITVAIIVVGRTGKALRQLVAVAVIGSACVTVPALTGAGKLTAVYGGAIVKNRPSGAFTDPNELGSYAAIALLLSLGWLLATRRRSEQVLAGVAAGGAAAALALSLSRGAWVGAAIGLAVLVTLHPRARRPMGQFVAGSCVVAVLGILVLPASGPVHVVISRVTSVGTPNGNPYDVRPITWDEALREFSAAPVFGNGPGSFSVLSARSPSELQFYPRQHAHNGLLTVAAEMGFAGATALIGLVVTLLLAVRARARRLREAGRFGDLGLLAGGAGALAALAGHLSVDYPLRNPTLMITVWAVLGLVLAATAIPAPGRRAADERAPGRDAGQLEAGR